VIEIIKQMYNVSSLDKVPIDVLDMLDSANELCKRAGGQLVSRQIIASIIITTDTLRRYDKESKYYVGNR